MRTFVGVGVVLTSLAVAGCGGDKTKNDTAAASASQPAATGAVPATTAGNAEPAPGAAPEGATPAMLALGDSIFHGQAAGGLCFTCHGPDAKGTALAPPLVSHKWLTGDGTYAFIQQRVTQGMPTPTPPYPAPMVPMGGAQLTPDQIKAVASYVFSISR
ncbi:MAG: c-type cytochrome [Gemmatimonadaceae bacterium]